MKKDKVFATRKKRVRPFEFNKEVAQVFDDMLNRSVPLYGESILRQAQLAACFHQTGTRIYDLGCSHGNLGIKILDHLCDQSACLVGVDNSLPMIEKYVRRLKRRDALSRVNLICGRLEDVVICNASVVIVNLTLQFLPIQLRTELIARIYQGLTPGGVFLLTEKIVHPEAVFDDLYLQFYTEYKRENGYSDLEISQKREALEKVLIPEPVQVHESRIRDAGFTHFDVWLKWFNFAAMMAVK